MEDDIDIEEHDVWENPRIKSIFPDLTIVKTEVPEFREYPDQDIDYYYYQQDDNDINNEANALIIETDDGIPLETIESINEYPVYGNKIILGSKKCTTRDSVILDSNNDQLMNDPKLQKLEPILFLEDWRTILENNMCYCRECKILYPTENALDAHKMITHSLLVAIDCLPSNKAKKSTTRFECTNKKNTAIKSTAKHFSLGAEVLIQGSQDYDPTPCPFCDIVRPCRNSALEHCNSVHKINLIAWENRNNKPTLCNHCNEYFTNDTDLIKHLYEMLPMKGIGNAVKVDKPTHVVATRKESTGPKFCYQCPICFYYFINKNKFHVHAYKNHSVERLTATYTKYKALCDICNVVVRFRYQSRHMRKYHLGIFYKNCLNKKIMQIYKCLKCSKTFDNSISASRHRRSHVEFPFRRLIMKVQTNKPEQARKTAVDDGEQINISNKEPIPKSALFSCQKCFLHFCSFTETMIHVRSCNKSLEYSDECQICHLLIHKNSLKDHKLQHTFTDKFKVYGYEVQLLRKLLCKCSNCDTWYNRANFLKHFDINCSKTLERRKCNECNIYFTNNGLKYHRKTHAGFTSRAEYLNKNDFIRVEYFTLVNRRKKLVAVKRKLENNPNETPTKRKIVFKDTWLKEKPYKIFYCSICKRCTLINKTGHSDGSCKKKQFSRSICKICGVAFADKSYIRHQKMHDLDKNLNFNDFKVTFIQEGKTGVLPLPEYYYCRKCHVNFRNGIKRKYHNCTSASYVCPHCKKKFDQDSYMGHVGLHMKDVPKPCVVEDKTRPHEKSVCTKKNFNEKIELLEKYNCMKTIWDVLYQCDDCNVVTASYDKTVEHCQNHITDAQKTKWPIERCNICKLNFNKTCYVKHKELHLGKVKMNKSSFRILKYSYVNILSKSWLNLFDIVDEEQKQQILSRSIYGVTRTVRMELVKDGHPNMTLYKCRKCMFVVDPKSIQNHVNNCNCDVKNKKFDCAECKINFYTTIARNDHEKIHDNKTEASFRIVSFNNTKHDTINRAIDEYMMEINNQSYGIVDNGNNNPAGKFTFFQCIKCGVCLRQETSTSGHRCGMVPKVTCHKCDISLSTTNIDRHRAEHKKYTNLNKNNIIVTVFIPNKRDSYKEAEIDKTSNIDDQESGCSSDIVVNGDEPRLYRCECGLHFICMRSIKKHLDLCNSQYDIVKEKCSKCSLLFSTKSLVNHLCRHHSNGNTKLEIEDVIVDRNEITDRLYRCGICDTIFHHSSTLSKHLQHCNGNSGFVECTKCHVKLHYTETVVHEKLHETEVNIENFTFVTINVPAKYITLLSKARGSRIYSGLRTENENTVIVYVIYKCEKCDLCYLTTDSLRVHQLKRNHVSLMQILKCNYCPLKFTVTSVKQHMNKHHSNVNRQHKRQLKIITMDYCTSYTNEQYIDMTRLENEGIGEQGNIESAKNEVDAEESSINNDEKNKPDVEMKNGEKTEDSDYSSFDEVETKNPFPCKDCDKKFKTGRALEIHAGLDHCSVTACKVCGELYNYSILNDTHLKIDNGYFVCCVCAEVINIDHMEDHSDSHKAMTIS